VASRPGWKKSAAEELGVPVGTGSSGSVMSGSMPSPSQGQQSGGREVMLASEVAEQGCSLYPPDWGRVWEWQRSKRSVPQCCHLLSTQWDWEMVPRCRGSAGPHCAFRIAVVWRLARWSQYVPCTAELHFLYTLSSFSLLPCNPGYFEVRTPRFLHFFAFWHRGRSLLLVMKAPDPPPD